jgi:hypothetical protein
VFFTLNTSVFATAMRKPLTDVEQPLFVTRGCQPAFVGVKKA